MASAQSSQHMCHGRACLPHTWGSPRSLHRSESRHMVERQHPTKSVAHKRDYHPGALHEGHPVRVYSRSADKWVDGEIVKFVESPYVRVEYVIGEFWRGKWMHMHSEHLTIQIAITASDKEEKASCLECNLGTPHIPSYSMSLPCDTCATDVRTGLPWKLSSEFEKAVCQGQALPSDSQQTRHKPLMQGCHGAGGYGNASPYDKYISLDFLWRILESRDVVLIKGSWLLELYRQEGVLPCRQELPEEACWDPKELKNRAYVVLGIYDDDKPVVFLSVSHCWYGQDHPDPNGEQVQDIGPFLEAFFTKYRNADLAIFWCWCSFYQNRRCKTRTEEEQEAFERSFPYMDLFYTNERFIVWMLTRVPVDADNKHQYYERGWTTWESSVARMLTSGSAQYDDISRGPHDLDALQSQGIYALERNMQPAQASLPLDPDRFDIMMRDKHFTKGRVDLDAVCENYRRNFWEILSVILMLDLRNANLAGEGGHLAWIVQHCPRLERVSLSLCSGLGDADLNAFAHALQHSPQVSNLSIKDCRIGNKGAEIIPGILPECPQLTVVLVRCGIGSHGVEALANAPDNCPYVAVFEQVNWLVCLLSKEYGIVE